MILKPSPNLPCPCNSGLKYKKCCQKYHKGALPANAEHLMRSRYSAYAFGLTEYIIKTTHPDNPDAVIDRERWKEEILHFCIQTQFLSLRIIDFTDKGEEAFVTFEASLSSGLLKEKSRFLYEDGRWLYVDGVFDHSCET
jgi:SEC-C motif-containing protein